MIQLIFEANTPYGVFRDALHLPKDHTISDADIEAMKQQRINAWIEAVSQASSPPQE